MNKKILRVLTIVLLSLVCFTGCGDGGWKSKVELSELKFKDDYIVGRIKNKTDKYYDVKVEYNLKSGDLTNDEFCQFKLKPNSTKDIECLELNYDDSYSIEVNNIDLKELEIPSLNKDLNQDSLEYYFEEIYEEHSYNGVGLTFDFEDRLYPFITKAKYNEDLSEISIDFTFNYDDSEVRLLEDFDTKTNKPTLIMMFISNPKEETISKMRTRLGSLYSIVHDHVNTISVGRALLRTDIENGKCIKVDNWCIGTDYSTEVTMFLLERQ